MTDDSSKGVLNVRSFPTELRTKLKMRALQHHKTLQELVIEYLRIALDLDKKKDEEAEKSAKHKKTS
jgi:plasmid stability protein